MPRMRGSALALLAGLALIVVGCSGGSAATAISGAAGTSGMATPTLAPTPAPSGTPSSNASPAVSAEVPTAQGAASAGATTAAPTTATTPAQGTVAPPTAGTQPPAAPTGLTAQDLSNGDISKCTSENSGADLCVLLRWTAPTGEINGYRIYAGRTGGIVTGEPPAGFYTCPEGVPPSGAEATVPAGTTSYYLALDGEYSPTCVAVSAYGAAGESAWDVVAVESSGLGPVGSTWQTYSDSRHYGFKVDYPTKYYAVVDLAMTTAGGYTYTVDTFYVPIGSLTNPEMVLAAEKVVFSGPTPPNTSQDLVAFFEKTLAYYAPYCSSSGTLSDEGNATLDGHAGYSFTLIQGLSLEEGEVFLVNGQLFAILGGGPTGSANSSVISRFLASFHLD